MIRPIPLLRLCGIAFLLLVVTVLIRVVTLAAAPPPRMRVLSSDEALRTDAHTIAVARGWDEAAAVARLKRQAATGPFMAKVAVTYPDTFAGSWLSDDVDGHVFIRFVGSVPTAVQNQAQQQGITAVFLGGAKYSLATLDARTKRVHADLVAHGHPQVVTAFSEQDETILATAMRAPGDTRPATELRARLSAESRAPDVIITFAQGPIAVNTDTHGGE